MPCCVVEIWRHISFAAQYRIFFHKQEILDATRIRNEATIATTEILVVFIKRLDFSFPGYLTYCMHAACRPVTSHVYKANFIYWWFYLVSVNCLLGLCRFI